MNTNLFLRFFLPLLAVLAAMAAALTPVTDSLIARWFQHDVEIRSRLIFNSIHDSLLVLARQSSRREMEALFERIAGDERVMAVGWCDGAGKLQRASKAWPKKFGCPGARAGGQPTFRTEDHGRGTVLVAAFPISSEDAALG